MFDHSVNVNAIIQGESNMNTRKQSTDLKMFIAEAYICLLNRRMPEEIENKQIIQASGVSSSSFYRYFKSTKDILKLYFNQKWAEYVKNQNIQLHYNYYENINAFFSFNLTERSVLTTMYNSDLSRVLYEICYEHMLYIIQRGVSDLFEASFLMHGLFGLLDIWIRSGFQKTPEELTALYYEYTDLQRTH